jgi:hypothetical protein
VNCVFCSNEIQWEHGHPKCDCGGNYFTTPSGSLEVKIACPCCSRNILLDNSTYGHKIACSCDTYLAVIEAPASILSSSEAPLDLDLLNNDGKPENLKTSKLKSSTNKSYKRTSPANKLRPTKRRKSTKYLHKIKKQNSKVPIVFTFVLISLGSLGFYLFANRDSLKKTPAIALEPKKALAEDAQKKELVAQILVPKVEVKSYQAKTLHNKDIEQIINHFGAFHSDQMKAPVKVDLAHFKSIRKDSTPQFKKSLTEVKIVNYQDQVKPFFEIFCIECHGPDKQKGDMRLDKLSYTLKSPRDVQHWQDILDSLNGAQMPPKKSTAPDIKTMSTLIRTLSTSLNMARTNFASQTGVVTMRRLNRREYKNTLEDLLAVSPQMDYIPEDNLYNNFDTVGESLTISPFQVMQYFKAAEAAVTKAVATRTTASQAPAYRFFEAEVLTQSKINGLKRHKTHSRIAAAKYEKLPETKTGALIMPQTKPTSGRLNRHDYDLSKELPPGKYIVRVHSSLVNPSVQSIHLNVEQFSDEGLKLLSSFPVFTAFGEAQINEFELIVSSSQRAQLSFLSSPRLISFFDGESIKLNAKARANNNLEGNNNIWIDRLEFIGPLDQKKHFLNLPEQDIKDANLAAIEAEKILADFAKKAFRGAEVEDAYLQRLMKVFTQEFDYRKSFEKAIIRPLSTILSSGRFLYMLEKSSETRHWVSDRELAIRLSYFLWSTMPDKELHELAERKILHKKNILQTQINRMVDSPKFKGFLEGFVSQWFELDHLSEVAVNENIYKNYNDSIKLSSIKESQLFIRELFHKNLSLHNIIKSDFAVMDDSMALFYGLPPKGNNNFRVFDVSEDEVRSGLLGHSSILTLTSNGERTSPVERGAYILEKFLNFPTMNPPPNVPALDIDVGGQIHTVRESIAKHSALPQCASCHDLIDPLGFAMENLDAVGKWRTHEVIPQEGRKVKKVTINATGRVLESAEFTGYSKLRDGLYEHKEKMTRAFIKALLIYSLGRPVGFQDEELIDNIYSYAEANDFGAKSILYAIVSSDAFSLK